MMIFRDSTIDKNHHDYVIEKGFPSKTQVMYECWDMYAKTNSHALLCMLLNFICVSSWNL